MFHVREFEQRDAESVLYLLNLKDIINSGSFSEKVFHLVETGDLLALVAETNQNGKQQIVGCAFLRVLETISRGYHGQIEELAIDKAWIGQGVGKDLMDRALSWAQERGVSDIYVDSPYASIAVKEGIDSVLVRDEVLELARQYEAEKEELQQTLKKQYNSTISQLEKEYEAKKQQQDETIRNLQMQLDDTHQYLEEQQAEEDELLNIDPSSPRNQTRPYPRGRGFWGTLCLPIRKTCGPGSCLRLPSGPASVRGSTDMSS
ncbi:hypothetical protein GAYE_SCF54G6200 [Galdieria yellowstonensis]|uniref:N-acetyltransferase domain-containing protein n=1 Tax=Galdieria yellowstonensis TaxID=3028027 RepID=A0AAV9ILW6_9RHOD|nr:hypothetical protein GAYE_SCF54G6200 [Galdieria yellowstonensis]